jgi:hypothetical protein
MSDEHEHKPGCPECQRVYGLGVERGIKTGLMIAEALPKVAKGMAIVTAQGVGDNIEVKVEGLLMDEPAPTDALSLKPTKPN